MFLASHSGIFAVKGRVDLGRDVILGPGSTEAANGLELVLARLGRADLDRLLVDDGIKLLAHLSGLGLLLDLVAVDDPAAIGIGAKAVALFHGAGALVLGLIDDLERAMPIRSGLRHAGRAARPSPCCPAASWATAAPARRNRGR